MLKHVLVAWLVLSGLVQAADTEKPVLALESGGHHGSVNSGSVFFSRDGKELISTAGGSDTSVRIWNVENGTSVRTLRLPFYREKVGRAALSPDGLTLAVARPGPDENDNWIYLITLASGRIEQILKGHTKAIVALTYSGDGKLLASAAQDNTARLFEAQTGKCVHVLQGHKGYVNGVAFSPDGRYLATCSNDETARVWSVSTGETKSIIKGENERLYSMICVCWSPEGDYLATGSMEPAIRVWTPEGQFKGRFKYSHIIRSVRFVDGIRGILFTSQDGDGGILDTEKRQLRLRFNDGGGDWQADLSPDGKLIATGGLNGVSLWKASDSTLVREFKGRGRITYGAGWGRDGTTVAWGYGQDASYRKMTPLEDGGREGKLNAPHPLERTFNLATLEFGGVPDDTFLRFKPPPEDLAVRAILKDGFVAVHVQENGKTLTTLRGAHYSECFSFLPGDRIVMSVGGVFEARTGKSLLVHRGLHHVRAIALSPNQRYLLTTNDQVLRVWHPDREDWLLSLFVAGDEWIAWTPEGYYAASPGGEKLMGWQVNHGHDRMATFYSAAQFRKTLYRPDVIKLLLETGSVEKALEKADKARGKASQRTEIDKVLPPKVAITSPDKTGLKLDKPEVEVKAAAESVGDHPVTALRLLIDGRPYQGEAGIQKIAEPKLGKTEISWTVKIEPGKHTLAVQAESAVSKAVSDEVEVIGEGTRGLGKTPEQLPDKTDVSELPSLYVLAVGVSAYKGDRKLNYAAKDAEALAKVCQEKSKALFRQVEVKLITDEKATRREILQGLTWLRKQMTQRDVGMIFFAGHGMKDSDSSFYLLPIDGDPDDLLSTAVPGDQIKRTLASVPGKIMVLLDACHAGSVDGGEKRRAATSLTDDLVRDLVTDDYGVIVMCSAMGREYALESATVEHGYFTLALTEGLSGKAANKDGVVYLHTLDAYVTDRVKELSKGRQHPVTAKPSTIRSFPLAKP